MESKYVSGSIVLYHNDIEEVKLAINSFLKCNIVKLLILVDNSINDELVCLQELDERIKYIHCPSNPGFGHSHNTAFKEALDQKSVYHFVINPDVFFDSLVINEICDYLNKYSEVGMLMPQILNTDGSMQFLPKLLPSPYSILLRKLKQPSFLYKSFIKNYELREVPIDQIYEAPILSGCFTAFRMNAIKEVGMYDDKFFMYFEDWDISRRMNQKYKTIYYPKVSVYHGYESGANKSKKLFKIFIDSAIHYFNKWGWFFDKERINVNRKTLKQFK